MTATSVRLTGRLDPRDGWQADRCQLVASLDVVGQRSTLLLLREAWYGTTRFDDFVTRAGISEPVAAARLRELVDHGLLERTPYREPGQRERLGYRLTPKGLDLLPAMVALMQWGDRWRDDAPSRIEVQHRDCGAAVHAELRCASGHAVDIDSMDLALRGR